MIIDDGYVRNQNRLNRKGYEHYRNHENTIRELTAFDDIIVHEIKTTSASVEIGEEYDQEGIGGVVHSGARAKCV